ncbi:ribonuclease H-like domain-containing protein [Artemisia annua]|uniref:Ribonuclease H-like domain-containing protein n=1 Tax=Artemisia annua TaxID=35608 RepID=A0A2U1Q3G4_ARTAN|nr:ribonuclease H-like domain-containing protein [Artemisia annua]
MSSAAASGDDVVNAVETVINISLTKPNATAFASKFFDNKKKFNNNKGSNSSSSNNPSNRGPNPNLKCTNCNKIGHTVDRCFEIIGYPAGHPKRNFNANTKLVTSNNASADVFETGVSKDLNHKNFFDVNNPKSPNDEGRVSSNDEGTELNSLSEDGNSVATSMEENTHLEGTVSPETNSIDINTDVNSDFDSKSQILIKEACQSSLYGGQPDPQDCQKVLMILLLKEKLNLT